MAAIFSYIQDQPAAGDPASATFASTPTEGSLLIAVGQERSGGSAASLNLSGSGWTKIISRTIEQTDGTFRRSLAVWIKTAGPSEPTNIQLDDGTSNTKYLLIQEIGTDTPVTWAVETSVSNDNGTTAGATSLSTGTTGSAPSGNLLLLGVGGLKYSNAGGTTPPASFASTALTVDAYSNTGGFVMWTALGWTQIDPGSGTYASTVTWGSAPGNNGLSAAMLVISGTEAGGGSHDTTGALAAQAATISGTAVSPHLSTGALSAQAATIAGSAQHQHVATGSLSAGSATIAGTAFQSHNAVGALQAGSATISGAALHPRVATGALQAGAATVAGTALHPHTTTGALVAGSATLAGSANLGAGFNAAGALQAGESTIVGSATRSGTRTSTGALQADAAQITGTAAHLTLHTTSGALVAGSATLSGTAQNGTVAPVAIAYGNLSFDWPPRKQTKRNNELEGLREELEVALGVRPAPSDPAPVRAAKTRVRIDPPPALAQALRNLRKLPDTASALAEIAKLRVAVQEADVAVKAETARRVRRRRQQQQILLMS